MEEEAGRGTTIDDLGGPEEIFEMNLFFPHGKTLCETCHVLLVTLYREGGPMNGSYTRVW